MMTNQNDDIARLRRVLPEQAISLAMQNRWSEAADVNRKIIELYPSDADAYNRLGKALMEMGRYRDALTTYQRAIELDPNNIIAKKNVERLVHLADKAPAGRSEPTRPQGAASVQQAERINPNIFIEETGKTGLTTLVNLGQAEVLLKMAAGDRVELRANGSTIEVYDEAGQFLGAVEARLSKRLSGLMEGGNRYTAAVTTVSGKSITIIIRETYQHPSQRGKLSFPPKALPAGAYRPYMREGALRYGMEEDEEGGFDYDADESDSDTDDSEDDLEYADEEETEEEEEEV
ncbi:MAG TPA: tetratricopeptide repeat protein [Chloroflexia bacterium]|nr:tetratricopeptide repeat protein [Chloroflexia bacterium]